MAHTLIYNQPLPRGGEFILKALSAPSGVWQAEAEAFGAAELYALAERNRVTCPVGFALQDTASGEWRGEVELNARRVEALLERCQCVFEAFEGVGVHAALFESGGVLAATEMPPAAFQSGDLDILVGPEGWERAHEVLRGLGFSPRARRQEGIHRTEFQCEDAEHALYLDLARVPFERMTAPLPFVDRTITWLNRRVPSPRWPGLSTLHPTDLLVQVAVHTSLHQFVLSPGLRLHMDVERLVRDSAVSWDAFVSEVDAVGLRTRAFVSLSMAAGLLGASIPEGVLRELSPGEERVRGIFKELTQASVFSDDGAKLRGRSALHLDRLLDDRGGLRWLSSLLLPSADWLRPRLELDGAIEGPDARLHVHRARRFIARAYNRA